MEATIRRTTETPIPDLGTTTRHVEGLPEAGGKGNGEELRVKAQALLEKAKVLLERLQEKTVNASKAADRTIRTHPYQAIGIALGVGAVICLVAMRKRRG
jgi:ElaB/YqjD/DUF883 family membrane-anchored ribosome-binding protein